MKCTTTALLLTCAAVLLATTTGCAQQRASYADLTEAPAVDKPTPADLPEYALEDFDVETIRWVGEHDGTEFWLGEGAEDYAVCFLGYVDAEDWVGGCAGDGGTMGTRSGDGPVFHVVPDGGDPPSGATKLSNNVYVTED